LDSQNNQSALSRLYVRCRSAIKIANALLAIWPTTIILARLNSAIGVASFAAGGRGSQALHNGTFVWSDDASGATQLKSSGTNQFPVRSSGGFALYSNAGLTFRVMLRAGSGSWASLSDRASRTNVVALDLNAVLAKVAALPVHEWSYRSEDAAIRHLGPMA
jgi:hypothetical protein